MNTPRTQAKLASAVDRYLSTRAQNQSRGLCLIVLSVFSGLLIAAVHFQLPINTIPIVGGVFIISGIYLELLMLHWYYAAAYYRGLPSRTGSGNYSQQAVTFDVTRVIASHPEDITKALLTSSFGVHIYVRAELPALAIETFLASDRITYTDKTFVWFTDRTTTLLDLVDFVLAHDTAFADCLTYHHITKETIRGAAAYVMQQYYEQKRAERWWSRDVLSQRLACAAPLVRALLVPKIPFITQVSKTLPAPTTLEILTVQPVAALLQTTRNINLTYVVSDQKQKAAFITTLTHLLYTTGTVGAINTLCVAKIDHESLFAHHHTTIEIETALRAMLQSIDRLGTITLIIDDLLTTTMEYRNRGVQFTHLLEEFLSATQTHVIILVDHDEYTYLKKYELMVLKRTTELLSTFESKQTLLQLLTKVGMHFEENHQVIVTYPALEAIATAVTEYKNYDATLVMKLLETCVKNLPAHTSLVSATHVTTTLAYELTLPTNRENDKENITPLSLDLLEATLNQTIVGQERAIATIMPALERFRHVPAPPLPSLLFLGQRGVGKTAVAKLIARHYFGNDAALTYIDMRNYHDEHSVTVFTHNGPTNPLYEMIERSGGVLVLDEFAEAHPNLQDFFINLIVTGRWQLDDTTHCLLDHALIVATTSLAGPLIAKTTHKRRSDPILDTTIIDHLATHQLLRDDVLTNFGEVVIFDSLSEETLMTILERRIKKLQYETASRGYTLVIDSGVRHTIINKARDGDWSAQTIITALKEQVEPLIARAIIRGEVQPGGTLSITPEQLNHE